MERRAPQMSGFENQRGTDQEKHRNVGNRDPTLKGLACKPTLPETQCRSDRLKTYYSINEGDPLTNFKAVAAGTLSRDGSTARQHFCNLILTSGDGANGHEF